MSYDHDDAHEDEDEDEEDDDDAHEDEDKDEDDDDDVHSLNAFSLAVYIVLICCVTKLNTPLSTRSMPSKHR